MENKIPLINVDYLYKNYGELKVLKDISVQFYEGEVVSIIGPSGCGNQHF